MSKTSLSGIAGVHYVVSELSRRGMVALPTTKNIAAYDIVALNMEGTKHANIQVKASLKRVLHFPMPHAAKVRVRHRDFYVFVRWVKAQEKYEGFLLTGKEARRQVQETVRRQQPSIRRKTRKAAFPTVHVGPRNEKNAKRWSAAWAKWKL